MTETFRWGIVGAARIARSQFVPGVHASKTGRVVAVASRELERARAMASDLEIPRAYGDYEQLLHDPDVDAVYIGLPNNLHAEWTIRAAEAGKHVLCEKPLARAAAVARDMAEACHRAGVVLMEAFMWRHHPQHARVMEVVRSGAIGEPVLVRGSFTYPIPAGPNVRLERDLEGGSLMDVGCYPVNVARWAFGAEPVACVGVQVIEQAYGVETSFAGALRFDGGRLALIDSSFRQSGTQRYEIVGSLGRIVVPRAFRPDEDPGVIEITDAEAKRTEEVPAANQYALEADHFAASARVGHLLAPAEDGVEQARVIEALYAAAERA
jgi:xylose dehydrogenase (NAD/NADP)